MKPDPVLQPGLAAAPGGDLVMRPVIGTTAEGLPLLAGVESGRVLDLSTMSPAPGQVAICRDSRGHVAVLGYVGAAQLQAASRAVHLPDGDGWLTIGFEKAQIRLHPDGRVRIKAEDIALDSSGRMALHGAWIDLN